MMNIFDNDIMFNRYTNLDGIEWRIIEALVKSDSKYAKLLWKMLKYDVPDCISNPEENKDLTTKERYSLIYRDMGEASGKKVFMLPFIDDSWTDQSSRLNIYVERVDPYNYVVSKVNVCFEIVVHNKINNIYGDADEDNSSTNPTEIDSDGNIVIKSKSRATTMLKCICALFNGMYIEGVGELALNQQTSPYCGVRSYVWNNRSYFGYAVTFSTLMGQVSETPDMGW